MLEYLPMSNHTGTYRRAAVADLRSNSVAWSSVEHVWYTYDVSLGLSEIHPSEYITDLGDELRRGIQHAA